MIDAKTQHELNKIREYNRPLIDKVTRQEKTMSEEKAQAEYTLKRLKEQRGGDGGDSRTNALAARALERQLASGAYDKERTIVNDKVAKEINDRTERAIRDGIRAGRIKPAEKDKFMRELESKR